MGTTNSRNRLTKRELAALVYLLEHVSEPMNHDYAVTLGRAYEKVHAMLQTKRKSAKVTR